MSTNGGADLTILARTTLLDALEALRVHRASIVVDNAPMIIRSLVPGDTQFVDAIVAGPSALIVAKMHKISDRVDDGLRRNDKDAHDVSRMLVACRTQDLAPVLAPLADDQLAGHVTRQAIATLNRLFAQSAGAAGCVMAGRAETGVGDRVVVSAATQTLAEDLIQALRDLGTQGL